ncbi:MAG: glycosyltransferase family 39 protein, partial [Acidobacteria bacterium]|nr:glycosyltransferase family 39 protein [Acidobacteriota bacterium]
MPFLRLPFISDDYTQIYHSRHYGTIDGFGDLAGDVLYRSRGTSLVLTHLVDNLFGFSAQSHRVAGVLLHMLNIGLVCALGSWRVIGWKLSLPAAVFYAFSMGHQEAVVWTAALPELLVFAFSMISFLSWRRWLDTQRPGWLLAVAGAFMLALFSKESAVAVVPLMAVAWWLDRSCGRRPCWVLAGMTLVAMVYAYPIFRSGSEHLHLHDGTFSWQAPFWVTLPHSIWRLLWVWGLAALAVVAVLREREWNRVLLFAGVWIVVTLLPYSFLVY